MVFLFSKFYFHTVAAGTLGARVPPQDWVTTETVREAARVKAISTVHTWVKRGILPEPTIVNRGRKGRAARWPLHTPAQAAWVADQLDAGFTLDEIREALKRGDFTARP